MLVGDLEDLLHSFFERVILFGEEGTLGEKTERVRLPIRVLQSFRALAHFVEVRGRVGEPAHGEARAPSSKEDRARGRAPFGLRTGARVPLRSARGEAFSSWR